MSDGRIAGRQIYKRQVKVRAKALTAVRCSLLLVVLLGTLKRDSLYPADLFIYRTDPFAGLHRFDWWAYELRTVWEKQIGRVLGIDQPRGLDRERRIDQVREYFTLVEDVGRLRGEIVTTRAREGEKADVSALQAELDAKRAERLRLENLVENIIRDQIEEVLLSQGIGLSLPLLQRWVLPPVEFELQSSPDFLIISRRDRIERVGSLSLQPYLSLGRIEELERLTDALAVSSLVVPTGGVGAYPPVITEDASLHFTISAVVHEWAHNYLYFQPLGQHYGDSQELISMNETVASMVDDEMSLELERVFYPDLYEVRLAERNRQTAGGSGQVREDEFNFNANMRKIRLRVEELLSEGRVEEAEAYMEEGRQKLVEMGYFVRKLNQAYFAFYGSYAAGKGWAAATNPIGEQLSALRERSPSLAAFLGAVCGMSRYQDLLDELAREAPG